MDTVDTQWGYEIWNKFDGALKHVHGNIEIVEMVQKFNQERLLIEQSYAQKLKKLVRKYATTEPVFSAERAVTTYLNEVSNIGMQHDKLAANLEQSVVKECAFVTTEWRKMHKNHQMEGIRLDKILKTRNQAFDATIKKYREAHQEMLRTQEAFLRADEDRKLSRAEVDKAKNTALIKRQEYDRLKAEYASQRQDFNAFQRDHYQQQLPKIFKDLEGLDANILAKLNGFLYKAGVSESTVANDLMHNYEAISKCAEIINWTDDAELLVTKLRSEEVPPNDRPFHDLDQESPVSSVDNVSNGQGAAGGSAGRSHSISLSSKNSTKKDRPSKFLRGLFNGSMSGSPGGAPGRNKVSLRSTKRSRSRHRHSKGSQDIDDKPDVKQLEKQVVDVETAIALAEKQNRSKSLRPTSNGAALEKLILMQEQNQKTCDMDQVQAEMTQIESHLTDLQARLARGEQDLAAAAQKVSKSRSLPSLNDIKRRARLSLRRKKTHYDVNESRNSGSTSVGLQQAPDANTTDDDDDYEFGPREPSLHSDQASDKNSFKIYGATEGDSSTDKEPHSAIHQPFVEEVPGQFADTSSYDSSKQQIQQETKPEERETQYIEIQNEHFPCIGSAVSLYPFIDNEDSAMLNMQAQEQFYVLHRDDDWTYVTRVDGSAKGMVPTTYLRILMY